MGSTGSGRFGNYPSGETTEPSNKPNGTNQCPDVIELINLDDVALSQYYNNYNNVPEVNLEIEISSTITNKRLVVLLSSTKEIIGNLPIQYNFLNFCLNKGISYSGTITSSGISPIPYIVVTVYAK